MTRPDVTAIVEVTVVEVTVVDCVETDPHPTSRTTNAGSTAIVRMSTLTFAPSALVPPVLARRGPPHGAQCETVEVRRVNRLAATFAVSITQLRWLLSSLLIAGAALFATGVAAERNATANHTETSVEPRAPA